MSKNYFQRLKGASAAPPPAVPPGQSSHVPSAPPASRAGQRSSKRLPIVLVTVAILILLGSGGAAFFLFSRASTGEPSIAGHAFFVSSGQVDQSSDQGIADGLRFDLQPIPDPQPGKRYYAWLLSEVQVDRIAVFLGALAVKHGQVTLSYNHPQHNDLLATYSRLLITEEDASPLPTNPSIDPSTWRYGAAFSLAPNPADSEHHYSQLDHLRHLLAQDPKLKQVGLPGGLNTWLYRNMTKIVEWAGSARDAQNSGDSQLILRQVTRILDYLDGAQYVQTENLPADIQGTELLVDPTIARVALLEVDPLHQDPPGYLNHIGSHLRSLTQVPNVTAQQRTLAIQITQAINNVQSWLNAVHTDARQLVHMSRDQLLQPGATALLDDLFTQANNAFVGQIDPNTNQVQEGVVQIYNNIQRLATLDITACPTKNASCV